MDKLGISCFATPSELQFDEIRRKVAAHLTSGGAESRLPHANQLWMLVGFELFRRVGSEFACIEVFPNAIVRAIAPGSAHKSKREGFEQQLEATVAAAQGDSNELDAAAHGSRHDKLDAMMSAWIASVPAAKLVAHGDGALDTIYSIPVSVRDVA